MQDLNPNVELATILESITDAFFALDHRWRFTYLNSAAARVLRRRREELLGQSVWEEFPEAVGLAFYREYRRAVEERVTVDFEEYFPPLETWFEVKAYPLKTGLAVYFRDINRRKRAEEELRRSEERLRAVLVQYGGDLISIGGADGTIRYISPACERALGYKPEALIGTNAFDKIHPGDLDLAKKRFAERVNTPGEGSPIDIRFRHADGTWRDFETMGNNLLEDPAVRGIVIHARDITGRKRAERLLYERSEAIEASIDGISITNLEHEHTYVNRAHASMYGYDRPEELLGTSWKILYDQGQIRWMEQHSLPELEKAGHWRGEAVGKRRDGTTFDQEISLTAIDDSRVVCVVRDISGRKRAEEVLRESQAKLYEAQRVANIGSWEYYPREDRASWSDHLFRIFGLSPQEEAPRYREFLKLIFPADRRLLHELFQESLRYKAHQNRDFRIVRVDGEVRWVNAQYELTHDGKATRAVGTLHDVTGRKRTEEALQMSESSLAEAQRVARVGNWEAPLISRRTPQSDQQMRWSDELYRIFGFAPREITPTFDAIIEATHPDDRKWVGRAVRDATAKKKPLLELEHRVLHPDGEVRTVQARVETRYDATSGRPVTRFGTVLDITDLKQAEETQARLAAIVESSQDAIISGALDGTIESWNVGAEKLYGYSAEEAVGQNISILAPPELPDDVPEILRRVSRGDVVENRETVRMKKNGERLEISLTGSPVYGPSGNIARAATIARDITGRKALERQLEHQAFHDTLTGLPNRALLQNRLQHTLAGMDRREKHVALLFIDLDDFKVVNDSLGHLVGDQLLVAAARRLEKVLRSEDTAARFSGDEFVVLLEGAERAGESAPVAERIIETFGAPFTLGDEEVSTTTSIGISYGLSSQDTAEELLRRADVAMYEAKAGGKSSYRVFEQKMGDRIEEQQALSSDLRRALDREEFVLHYQPKIEVDTGYIIGTEALVRWNHPERGLVPPLKFIPLAEQTGLIVPIGQWVFKTACRQARVWHEQHPKEPPLITCVNVSVREFQNPSLVEDMAESIRETGVDPACVELEITESVLMKYGEDTFSKLRGLRELGVNIAIDDFGTGYSSLSYLQRLPVEYLKIDRSFVDQLGKNPESNILVSTIINLARSLAIKTVAEGVETEDQLSDLREMGCDIAQGYYFAKPRPAEEVSARLAENYAS